MGRNPGSSLKVLFPSSCLEKGQRNFDNELFEHATCSKVRVTEEQDSARKSLLTAVRNNLIQKQHGEEEGEEGEGRGRREKRGGKEGDKGEGGKGG